MAAAQHKVSRRALLGAAFALPALPRHPGSDPVSSLASLAPPTSWIPDQVRDDGKWAEAFACLRSAEAALAAVKHGEDDDLFDGALGAFNAALRRLLRCPAPGLAALALKIELAVDHEIATLFGGEVCLVVLKQDARRLAGKEGI
jgi:hypothetical protein